MKQLVVSFPGTGVSTPVPAVSVGAQIVRGQTPAAANPVAYWEGEVTMHGAGFDLGTDFTSDGFTDDASAPVLVSDPDENNTPVKVVATLVRTPWDV